MYKLLKIERQFWDLIIERKKLYEFRKLSKGITAGTYTIIDPNTKFICQSCEGDDDTYYLHHNDAIWCDNCGEWCDNFELVRKPFGTMNLKPIIINPEIYEGDEDHYGNDYSGQYFIEDWDDAIDNDSYNFIKENYIDKNIDYVVYEISDAKKENYGNWKS